MGFAVNMSKAQTQSTDADLLFKGGNMVALGKFIKIVGGIAFVILGLWGFFICLAIISKITGFWGLVVALFLAPVTFLAAPLYAGFAWGNWFPLILNYGGGVMALAIVGLGSVLAKE